MTGADSKKPNPAEAPRRGRRLPKRIVRRVALARALLVWERLWPGLWPAAGLVGLFVSMALFGAFAGLPMGVHWTVLGAFACLLAVALWQGLKGFRWPDREAALRHLEKASGFSHQPLAAYEDVLARGTGDRALWLAHQHWVSQRLKKLKLGFAAPGLASRDPYALRAIVVLLLVIGIAGTGTGRLHRVVEALLPGVGAAKPLTIEAWITPPAYTGWAPIYLERHDDATTQERRVSETALKVPVGSVLSLRVHGFRNPPALEIGNGDRGRPESLKDLGADNYSLDVAINNTAEFALTQGGRLMRGWTVEVIPDVKPTIALTKPLERTASGSLRFAYKVHDDYGVVSSEARIALARELGEKAPATRSARATPRITPPKITLPLPTVRPKSANGETYVDLTPHPWAGLPVTITLVATDDAGQEGMSQPIALTLPAREFKKPLAAATIEQRRTLAFDPASTTRVARMLDALTLDGARYIQDKSVYLALRAAYWRLVEARHDSDLTGIFDLMWSTALHIEDGDVSLAESDLRRSREALAQALAKGAGNDEIERLIDEMKQAFKRYMDALAAQGGQNAAKNPMDKFAPQDGQTIDRDQLEKMLSSIGDLARTGAREQAKAMLEKLQAIMENMQLPQQNAGMTPEEQAMAGAVDRMGKLIDKQRRLMDETFRQNSKDTDTGDMAAGAGSEDKTGTPGASDGKGGKGSSMRALKHTQEALRAELEKMMGELGKTGLKPSPELGNAQKQMKDAETRLGEGRSDRATSAQGRAIEGLRAGAQGLADQLMKSMAGRRGSPGRGNGNARTDPLGRALPGTALDLGNDAAIPDKIDIQRAREIIQELRHRASELGRPKIELEYLDRLLERF